MRINHTVRILITSDFLINSGVTLYGPVFAIFVTDRIAGGTVETVGFAAAITQIVKAVLQVPVARYLDRNHGEYDDWISMVTGTLLFSITPFLYLFASVPAHLFAIQAVAGTGLALAVPPWYAIFTRHIDAMRENVEWSLESIGIGISGATAAALSGVVVANFGFPSAFVIGGCVALLGALLEFRIYHDLRRFVGHREVKPLPDRTG